MCCLALPCANVSSIDFAMKTVQVTSEAKASPIITAFTTTSADMNIDHGDSSRGTVRMDFDADELSATGPATAGTSGAVTAGAAGAGAAGIAG